MADVRDTWGRYAAAFAAEGTGAEDRDSLRKLVELCALEPGERLLDVGCGAGYTSFVFARTGCRPVAVDPTYEMLEATRAGWAERGLPGRAATVEAWAEALPFADGSVDAVVAHRAPHQFRDRAAFLAEALRVVRPGGAVAIADQSPPDGWEDWHNTLERLRDPTHDRSLSPREWKQLFAESDLEIQAQAVVGQPHVVEEWLDRVDAAPTTRREVEHMLRTAPDAVRDAYAIGDHGGRLVMITPQAVVVARRP